MMKIMVQKKKIFLSGSKFFSYYHCISSVSSYLQAFSFLIFWFLKHKFSLENKNQFYEKKDLVSSSSSSSSSNILLCVCVFGKKICFCCIDKMNGFKQVSNGLIERKKMIRFFFGIPDPLSTK